LDQPGQPYDTSAVGGGRKGDLENEDPDEASTDEDDWWTTSSDSSEDDEVDQAFSLAQDPDPKNANANNAGKKKMKSKSSAAEQVGGSPEMSSAAGNEKSKSSPSSKKESKEHGRATTKGKIRNTKIKALRNVDVLEETLESFLKGTIAPLLFSALTTSLNAPIYEKSRPEPEAFTTMHRRKQEDIRQILQSERIRMRRDKIARIEHLQNKNDGITKIILGHLGTFPGVERNLWRVLANIEQEICLALNLEKPSEMPLTLPQLLLANREILRRGTLLGGLIPDMRE
ncbi:unnamed protein product, partial [Amoebophrya sp. A25]